MKAFEKYFNVYWFTVAMEILFWPFLALFEAIRGICLLIAQIL